MTRVYLRWWAVLLPTLILTAPALALRVERGNLLLDNIPEASSDLVDSLDGRLAARQAIPLGWSTKGQLLVTTRFGEVDELHLVDQPGGERRQISFLHDPVIEAAYSPDPLDPGYFYSVDHDGNERAQLFYRGSADAAPRLLTDGKSFNGAALWSNAGHEIAFFSTARDGTTYDIDIVDAKAGTLPRLVVAGDGAAWYPLDWSPDDRKLLVLKMVSIDEAYLYVVDVASGEKRELDSAPVKVGITGARFSRDGQGVYLISDRDSDFKRLRYVNLFTAEHSLLGGPLIGDVEELALSRDGRYLAYVGNDAGRSKLNLIDLKTHQDLTPPHLPMGLIDHLRFDPDGKRLAFALAPADRPRDAWVLDIAANRAESWTHSEQGTLDPSRAAEPRVTRFPTFDRIDGQFREEPVYVYEPKEPGPHPVLIVFHDGPQAQFRPAFDPWIEYVVDTLGYAVVAPNLRGSSGYGRAYEIADNQLQRDDVIKDLGALIVWVGSQSSFDAKHVIVSGAGYGGFLALAALANYGDRLRGGVDLGGIGDFVTYAANGPASREAARRAEFGDERDPDTRAFLRRISPLTTADHIGKPVLVVHGRNDARVPITQSEQMVATLRARGVEVWYLEARNEGYNFLRLQDREACLRAFATFLRSLEAPTP